MIRMQQRRAAGTLALNDPEHRVATLVRQSLKFLSQQRADWRDFIFARRRPKFYGIIPTTNEVIMRYRPDKGPWK